MPLHTITYIDYVEWSIGSWKMPEFDTVPREGGWVTYKKIEGGLLAPALERPNHLLA